MPTENRSSNTDPRDLFIRDNPLGLGEKELAKDRTGFTDQRTHSDYLTFLAGYEAAQPAEQHQGEPSEYPPCDYCGIVPDHHPWHGSGLLNGVENRHIHACDACRWQLPLHPGQHQGEPVAWLDPSAGLSWLVDRMDVALGTKLYTHSDTGEVERLKQELLVARAQGRAEVVEMIIALEAEAGLDEFIGSHQIGCTGEWGSHWKEDDLRNHFDVDPAAAGELERYRHSGYEIILLEEERDNLSAQLAERDALLRRCLMAVREQHCDEDEADFDLPANLMTEIDVALDGKS